MKFSTFCIKLYFLTFCLNAFGVEVNPYMVDMPREGEQVSGVWLNAAIRSKPTDLQSPARYMLEIENTNNTAVEIELIADYLQGQDEHTFDWLLHPVGHIETIGNVKQTGYLPRMKDDKASSYYYITNCDIYTAQGRVLNRFKDENLNLDVHTFLTKPAEMAIGTFPFHLCRQPVKVFKDGQEVYSEIIGVDSCGEYELDIALADAKELELRFARRTHSTPTKPGDYIALAMPQIITSKGSIELKQLNYTLEGAKPAPYGLDYEGNRIVIAGKERANAFMIEPQGTETIIKINLEGIEADSFYAVLGAVNREDWHSDERKTLRFRSEGNEFELISILEPYEGQSQIKSARLLPNNTLSIELKNGTFQEIRINELASKPTDDISVNFAQLKNGRVIQTEIADNPDKRLIHKDDFNGSLANWQIEQMPGGSVQLTSGVLQINDAAGCTVWFKEKLAAPVAIEYDVEVIGEGGANDRMSDINCFWMAQDPAHPDDIFAASAERGGRFPNYDSLRLYYVGYAANNNTTTRFRRYDGEGNKPLLPEHDLRGYTLEPGTRLHIKIIAAGEVNQYWVNGEKIYDFKDPEPFKEGYFGFRTVKNHIKIDNFRVYQLSDTDY